MKTAIYRVKEKFPDAFCVKLDTAIWTEKNGEMRYIVWPGKIQFRGFERPAIGLGASPRAAWASVKL